MMETRRGCALLIQSGDAAISGALAEGMARARGARLLAPAGGMDGELIRRVRNDLRRVDMRCHKPEQPGIEARIQAARMNYGQDARAPGLARRIGNGLLGLYALTVLAVTEGFRIGSQKWRG